MIYLLTLGRVHQNLTFIIFTLLHTDQTLSPNQRLYFAIIGSCPESAPLTSQSENMTVLKRKDSRDSLGGHTLRQLTLWCAQNQSPPHQPPLRPLPQACSPQLPSLSSFPVWDSAQNIGRCPLFPLLPRLDLEQPLSWVSFS